MTELDKKVVVILIDIMIIAILYALMCVPLLE